MFYGRAKVWNLFEKEVLKKSKILNFFLQEVLLSFFFRKSCEPNGVQGNLMIMKHFLSLEMLL
mgnify:CR=1 FL=1